MTVMDARVFDSHAVRVNARGGGGSKGGGGGGGGGGNSSGRSGSARGGSSTSRGATGATRCNKILISSVYLGITIKASVIYNLLCELI